jgi:hypothetical protein
VPVTVTERQRGTVSNTDAVDRTHTERIAFGWAERVAFDRAVAITRSDNDAVLIGDIHG